MDFDRSIGDQHPEHECGASGADVQELSIERTFSLGRFIHQHAQLLRVAKHDQ